MSIVLMYKEKKITVFLLFAWVVLLFGVIGNNIYAASLTHVRDVIDSSTPSAATNHTVQFVLTEALLPDEYISIVFEDGEFTVPSGFDYTDMDVSTAPSLSGPFTDRSLAAFPTALADGVFVVPGVSGMITITLNSTNGMPAGTVVNIELGDHATFEEVGIEQIINPAILGSYRIVITTKSGSFAEKDSATAMIAIVDPVGVGPVNTIDDTPPVISNGLPTGLLLAGTTGVEISVQTNEFAGCRYATTSDIAYGLMADDFLSTTGTLHRATIATGFENGNTYTYYVRCIDFDGNVNTDDYLIVFSIGVVSLPAANGVPGVGGGGIANTGPYLAQSAITLHGRAYPLEKVSILKDGVLYKEITVDSNGVFEDRIDGLEQGTYTIGISAQDGEGGRSSSYSTTVFLRPGTHTSFQEILLSPTIHALSTIDLNTELLVSGKAIIGGDVFVDLLRQSGNLSREIVRTATTTTFSDGTWDVVFDTEGLSRDTYEIIARSVFSDGSESKESDSAYVGIGEDPSVDFRLRADLNKDGSVDLIDFSILLFNWNTDDGTADINLDGNVNLSDFSIMIFYWTG